MKKNKMYGFADFIWLLLCAWIAILLFCTVLGNVIAIFTRSFGKKHVIAVTLKDKP